MFARKIFTKFLSLAFALMLLLNFSMTVHSEGEGVGDEKPGAEEPVGNPEGYEPQEDDEEPKKDDYELETEEEEPES